MIGRGGGETRLFLLCRAKWSPDIVPFSLAASSRSREGRLILRFIGPTGGVDAGRLQLIPLAPLPSLRWVFKRIFRPYIPSISSPSTTEPTSVVADDDLISNRPSTSLVISSRSSAQAAFISHPSLILELKFAAWTSRVICRGGLSPASTVLKLVWVDIDDCNKVLDISSAWTLRSSRVSKNGSAEAGGAILSDACRGLCWYSLGECKR